MSNDEMSDDALDAEHSNPAMVKKHAPKLAAADDPATLERVISLRDMRAEQEMPSEARARERAEERGEPVAPQTKPPLAARAPIQLRPIAKATGQTPFRSPALRDFGDADAWDKYVVGALPLVVGLVEDHAQAADLAAQFADAMLAERRRRFS